MGLAAAVVTAGAFGLLRAAVAPDGRWAVRAESGDTAQSLRERPIAAVLVQPPSDRVVLVDLVAMRPVATIRLRSNAFDIAADPRSRRFVTAQAGGIGDEADTACAVMDLKRGGAVSYVEMDSPNPSNVRILDGTAYVVHGLVRGDTTLLKAFDVATGTRTLEEWIPDTSEVVFASGGALWLEGHRQSADTPAGATASVEQGLLRGDLLAQKWKALDVKRDSVVVIDDPPSSEETRTVTLLGTDMGPDGGVGDGELVRLEADTGAVLERTTLIGLRRGVSGFVRAGDHLCIADFTSDPPMPQLRGDLVVYDAESLAFARSVKFAGAPAGLASWGGRMVVVDAIGDRLVLVDPRTGKEEGSCELGFDVRFETPVAVCDPVAE